MSAVVLFDFDGPVFAHQFQESLRTGFVRPEAGDAVNGDPRGAGHPPLAHRLDLAVNAKNLGGPGEAHSRPVDRQNPDLTFLDAAMAFIQRPRLRGEGRPAAVAGLWAGPGVGCP